MVIEYSRTNNNWDRWTKYDLLQEENEELKKKLFVISSIVAAYRKSNEQQRWGNIKSAINVKCFLLYLSLIPAFHTRRCDFIISGVLIHLLII